MFILEQSTIVVNGDINGESWIHRINGASEGMRNIDLSCPRHACGYMKFCPILRGVL